MDFALILICLFLLSGSSAKLGGCLTNIFCYLILAILLVFMWEHKIFICASIIIILITLYLILLISEYIKYKDETPEQREERIKMNKMIEDWKKRNNF